MKARPTQAPDVSKSSSGDPVRDPDRDQRSPKTEASAFDEVFDKAEQPQETAEPTSARQQGKPASAKRVEGRREDTRGRSDGESSSSHADHEGSEVLEARIRRRLADRPKVSEARRQITRSEAAVQEGSGRGAKKAVDSQKDLEAQETTTGETIEEKGPAEGRRSASERAGSEGKVERGKAATGRSGDGARVNAAAGNAGPEVGASSTANVGKADAGRGGPSLESLATIVDRVSYGVNAQGAKEFRIEFRGAGLDGLSVRVSASSSGQVSLVFDSLSGPAARFLEAHAPELVRGLGDRGVTVANVDVRDHSAGEGRGGQSPFSGQEQPADEEEGRSE